MLNRTALLSLIVLMFAAQSIELRAQSDAHIRYTSYEEAQPILKALNEILPSELRFSDSKDLPSRWSNWIVHRDAEIRARLARGDEDSIVNLLLFGTSFTQHPRIKLSDLAQAGTKNLSNPDPTAPDAVSFLKSVQMRVDDFIKALEAPTKNERLLFARQLIYRKGFNPSTIQGRKSIEGYLMSNMSRVFNEQASYARVLESARLLGDPSAEFAERSKLFATRGLSSDTSIFPNFAIERALISLKAQGLLTPGSVHRVGIIGPGLDFTDKQDGYDFYPQQTIQPFAVVDSLLRLGLARPNELQVSTFDLSERVNDHLHRAVANARQGIAYTIQLPREDDGTWKRETTEYWQRFGDRIGTPATPAAVPAALGKVTVRAVRIKPAIVSLVKPENANIVLQRPDISSTQRFDLLIATNILVYYDVFEQSLALTNIAGMLRPGGFLLSNNALLELPTSRMQSVGYETVEYSTKPNDGDHVVWYRRAADN